MRHPAPTWRLFSLTLLCALALLGATVDPASAGSPTFPDSPDGSYDNTSVQSGLWHDPATWGNKSAVPGLDADVLIQSGHTVTVARQETTRHRFIRVEGELELANDVDTRLLAETLYVFGDGPGGSNEGVFRIGSATHPVQSGVTAEVVFTSSGAIDLTWDAKQASRGLVSDGIIRLFGQPKTHVIQAPDGPFTAGVSSFFLEPPWGGWQVGDELVIAGTVFQRVPGETASQDERVTITARGGDQFQFQPALAYNHLLLGTRRFHIVNLTRNVILRSDQTTQVSDRGHIMLRSADVHIDNVRFVDLGRTDKRIPLDDKIIQDLGSDYNIVTPAPSAITNRRGRYALHFHLNGIQPQLTNPPSKVYGSVVDGTVGWGFVNHSSHVDFQRNIAYDFAGAGFVTELGDELGNFFDNVAIRGTGNGEYRQERLVFENPNRPQPLSDFGFSGDGFWFQGPALRVKNNIASGCDGAGMAWFTPGAPDVSHEVMDGGYVHNPTASSPAAP
ncbi:MAG: G8 domain-containing protein [Acidobacteriota bacterium]